MNLYKEALTDHYRNPRNRGTLRGSNFASESHNPSCGDSIAWQGHIGAGTVNSVAFEGKGCVISQGAASMLSEVVMSKTCQNVIALDTTFMLSLIGLELGPTRVRCALLPLEALQQGIMAYQKKEISVTP
jgi:nitrogen fixation NifU-like protein